MTVFLDTVGQLHLPTTGTSGRPDLRRCFETGMSIYATQLVAARTLLEAARDPSTSLYVNGVRRIYTFNPGDFQVFAELTVVAPT